MRWVVVVLGVMNLNLISRRAYLGRSVASALSVSGVVSLLQGQVWAQGASAGKVRHSVCKWCYKDIALETMCEAAKEIGLESVELLDPPDFAVLKKHGLHCAMVSFPTAEGPEGKKIGSIPHGFNRVEHHDLLVSVYEPLMKVSAEAGFKCHRPLQNAPLVATSKCTTLGTVEG